MTNFYFQIRDDNPRYVEFESYNPSEMSFKPISLSTSGRNAQGDLKIADLYGKNLYNISISGPKITEDEFNKLQSLKFSKENIYFVPYGPSGETYQITEDAVSFDIEDPPGNNLTIESTMLSHLGLGGWTPTSLVDGNTTTTGFNTDTSGIGSWMQIDFGVDNKKALLRWEYYIYSTPNIAIWNIQYSDNGTTWTTATSLDCGGNANIWKVATWDSVGAHRYWRSYKTNDATSGGYHSELRVTGAKTHIIHRNTSARGITIDAVYLVSDYGGTNYYLGGSYSETTREITLGVPLPSPNEDVIVVYTFTKFLVDTTSMEFPRRPGSTIGYSHQITMETR